jgi:hypothetical protein
LKHANVEFNELQRMKEMRQSRNTLINFWFRENNSCNNTWKIWSFYIAALEENTKNLSEITFVEWFHVLHELEQTNFLRHGRTMKGTYLVKWKTNNDEIRKKVEQFQYFQKDVHLIKIFNYCSFVGERLQSVI